MKIELLTHNEVLGLIEDMPRQGADVDSPEGSRTVTISDTLLKQIVARLRATYEDCCDYTNR